MNRMEAALRRTLNLLVTDGDPPALVHIEGVEAADVIEVYELVSAALAPSPEPSIAPFRCAGGMENLTSEPCPKCGATEDEDCRSPPVAEPRKRKD